MLRRVSRGLGHTAKQAQKVHLKVEVEKLDNLPAAVKKCRVVWSRGPKVQMTNTKDVSKGEQGAEGQQVLLGAVVLLDMATMHLPLWQHTNTVEHATCLQVPSFSSNSSAKSPQCTETQRGASSQR
jgi:hypothetical protein